ncbi:MAG: Uma2 family endonuclease [Armatimonadetes bacterium]|nr:Uma2 family endonuclease [Armatimonadota bacterium]
MTLLDRPEVVERFMTWTDWEGYLHILEGFKDRRIKITYDRGRLELLSPSALHELIKKYLGQLVELLLFETDRDYRPGGSTTFRRQLLDRGLEPDECYFLSILPRSEDYDPETWPAPDLAIEVEVTRSALDRMGIYQALAVREVWRYPADHRLRIEVLGEEGYSIGERSTVFADLNPGELPRFVRLGLKEGPNAMLRAFKAWLAEIAEPNQ